MNVSLFTCDIPTETGRVYPKAEIENVIQVFKTSPSTSFGFLDPCAILEDVAFITKDLMLIDNVFSADIELLATPRGKLLEKLLVKDPTKVVFSTKGSGNLLENVVTNYLLDFIFAHYTEV